MCWLNKCGHCDWQKLYLTKWWWIAHFRVCRPIFLISSMCWSMWQICKINWIAISFFFFFFFCLIHLIIIFSSFLRIISNSCKIEFKKKKKKKKLFSNSFPVFPWHRLGEGDSFSQIHLSCLVNLTLYPLLCSHVFLIILVSLW